MGAHNVLSDISEGGVTILSDTNASYLQEVNSINGVTFLMRNASGAQTRKMSAPLSENQEVMLIGEPMGASAAITIVSTTGWDGSANTTLTFTQNGGATAELWCLLRSVVKNGVYVWRVIAKGAGVTYAA